MTTILPDYLKSFLEFKGVDSLNPPQEESLPYLVGESRKNFVCSAPTGSGKTLVGEIGIIETCLIQKKKAAYLVPLRALAAEKYADFKQYEEKYGLKVSVKTGDYESDERDLKNIDIVVSTFEKFDSMSRKGPEWLNDMGIVVVDEAHSVTDTDRGPTLECMLTRMKQRYPGIKLLLLSAVMPNVEDFARWLDADFIKSNWRAVPLKQGVFSWSKVIKHNCGSNAARLTPKCREKGCGRHVGGAIKFTDGTVRAINTPGIDAAIPSLAVDILKEGGQALLFARSRTETVKQAQNIGSILAGKILDMKQKQLLGEFIKESSKRLNSFDANDADTLFSCIRNGTAYHNAGMPSELRKIVENGFRRFLIKVVACTPTLAAGVNLPARRVIVQQITRWTRTGSEEIPRYECENMLGRAGRRAYDTYGEAVLIGEEAKDKKVGVPTLSEYQGSANEKQDDEEEPLMKYLKRPIEEIESKLFTQTGILAHMLAEICQENGADQEYIAHFFSESFGVKSGQIDKATSDKVISEAFQFLVKYEMIRKSPEGYVATLLGRKFNQMYINPQSFENIQAAFVEAKKRFVRWERISPSGWLHLICSMVDWSFRTINLDYIDYVLDLADLLLDSDCTNYEPGIEGALVLEDFIEEVEEAQICGRYRVGKGDIRTAQDNAVWLLAAVKGIADVMGEKEIAASLSMVLRRVQKGVKEELLSLASVKEIGRNRARWLYNAGIKTREDLLSESNYNKASKIIGEGVLRRILDDNGQDLSKVEPTYSRQTILG